MWTVREQRSFEDGETRRDEKKDTGENQRRRLRPSTYYEWIYENGKFTEISAAHWCHVFLRGWCDGSSEKVEFLLPILSTL